MARSGAPKLIPDGAITYTAEPISSYAFRIRFYDAFGNELGGHESSMPIAAARSTAVNAIAGPQTGRGVR